MVIQIKNDCEKIIHIEKVQNFQFIHFLFEVLGSERNNN